MSATSPPKHHGMPRDAHEGDIEMTKGDEVKVLTTKRSADNP